MSNSNNQFEFTRGVRLNALIEELYGGLGPIEIENLASKYQQSEQRMLEVSRVRSRSFTLSDFFDDSKFKPVRFPSVLVPYIRKQDIFLCTIGLKGSVWTVIWLSPLYDQHSQSPDDQEDEHTEGKGGLVCRHLAIAGRFQGFWEPDEPSDSLIAWCNQCDAYHQKVDGDAKLFNKYADFKQVCGGCFAKTRKLNLLLPV